jgi:hypothetical protein
MENSLAMNASQWRHLSEVDPHRMTEARLQAHYAAQWLARAARAYAPEQPQDAHTNLGWDNQLGGLVTHVLKNGERIGLQIEGLTLAIMNRYGARSTRAFVLSGHTDAEARAWLGGEMSRDGLDATALDAPSPYEIPSHAIAKGARYLTRGLGETLAQLSHWYANADAMLSLMRQDMIARKLAPPPVRCWPHHFDLDTLLTFGAGKGARTMRVGFSPGDNYYNQPYFYVSLWPPPDVTTLPRLPAIAHWHTTDFTGAIVPALKIVRLRNQRSAVDDALRAAIDAAIRRLA